jgi:hypothetical protein
MKITDDALSLTFRFRTLLTPTVFDSESKHKVEGAIIQTQFFIEASWYTSIRIPILSLQILYLQLKGTMLSLVKHSRNGSFGNSWEANALATIGSYLRPSGTKHLEVVSPS